jgi:hypothetical protein
MRNVAPPMISSVTRNAYLRPTRSPTRPKTIAPNGRTANPVAKVASVSRIAAVGFSFGKNSPAMTAKRLPKM